MVVEDDDAIRELYIEILESEGYSVMVARNGAEALRKLKASPLIPDVIMTDLMMPVMSGKELVEKISQDDQLKWVPTIVISAYSKKPHVGTAFIAKPFEIDEMIEHLETFSSDSYQHTEYNTHP